MTPCAGSKFELSSPHAKGTAAAVSSLIVSASAVAFAETPAPREIRSGGYSTTESRHDDRGRRVAQLWKASPDP